MSSSSEEAAREALEDYRAKIAREIPARDELPRGEADSGVMVVLEPPHTPAVLDALARSLESVGHPRALVVGADERLARRMLSAAPAAVVAVGPEAARRVDETEYPLARVRFSESPVGEWFVWSKGVRGLALPPLAPALEDEEAKRGFWRAVLALRGLERAFESG